MRPKNVQYIFLIYYILIFKLATPPVSDRQAFLYLKYQHLQLK